MTTGEKIRRRRLELRMTMAELGSAIGVQRSAVNKYEKGVIDIKSKTLAAIAAALNIPVKDLLEDSPMNPDDVQPKTREARIMATAIDRMPPDKREMVLNMVKTVFFEYFDGCEG